MHYEQAEVRFSWIMHVAYPSVHVYTAIAPRHRKLWPHMFVQLSLYTFISFSWLLRNRDSEIRSLSSPYLRAVDRYLSNLLPLLVPLQVITGRLLCKKEDGNLTSFTVNLSWSIVNMFLPLTLCLFSTKTTYRKLLARLLYDKRNIMFMHAVLYMLRLSRPQHALFFVFVHTNQNVLLQSCSQLYKLSNDI